jgi:MoaA/NifB/PqqE/SkfB family radical SAM enzyme
MGTLSLIKKVLYEALMIRFRYKINHLILHVTNKCNMRCKHCFVSFDNTEKELTFNEIKSLSKHITDLIWLDIGGGEPLLRDDLADVVSLFNFKELSIPSNGWESDQIVGRLEKINRMFPGKLIVTLSLDGMQSTHDDIRCPFSFERTIQTFRGLKKIKGLRVKFNTVLCEKNYGEIIELMKFVNELRPAFHSILMLRGDPRDPAMRLPSINKIESLERDIYDIQRSYDYGRWGILAAIHKNYQSCKRNIIYKTLHEKRQVIPCLAGRSHLVVWSNGNVSPCELLPSLGNIREESLVELLSGAKMRKAISSIVAGNCFCTHDCNMIENILFNPRIYLELFASLKGPRQHGK